MAFRSLSKDYTENRDSHVLILVVAIVISIICHFAFGYITHSQRFTFLRTLPGATAIQRLALRNDSAVRAKLIRETTDDQLEQAAKGEKSRDRVANSPDPLELLEASTSADASSVIFEPPPASAATLESITTGLKPPVSATANAEPVVPWEAREEVLLIASKFANDEFAASSRREIPSIERTLAASDVVAPYKLVSSESIEAATRRATEEIAQRIIAPASSEVVAPEELLKPTAEVVAEAVEAESTAEAGEEAAAFLPLPPEEVAPALPIENALNANVAVFRPARDDGYVYYRVDVQRKGADFLPAIPRDILIAQDASGSIGERALAQSRHAIKAVLSSLRESDRFNVLAFSSTNGFAFGKSWRAPTKGNVEEALKFLGSFKAKGNTDLYSAMRGALDLPQDPERAVIVFLISDGRPTVGLQRDSMVIGEFSRQNQGRISIYGIGVAQNSSDYMLSMLSLCNRGAPAVMPENTFKIEKSVTATVAGTGTPVLTDVHFVFDSASDSVIAPVSTSNLYMEQPLSIYGRAPVGTREVTFQALGRNAHTNYDMIFTLDLGGPLPGEGDSTIPHEWATARIYDLVAEFNESNSQKVISEMNYLGRIHNVKIPFKRFERP